jgi:hypothetical protein
MLASVLFAANVRVDINLGAGHPIHRPRTVVIHRAPLVVERSVVYAPPVVWSPVIVQLPPRAHWNWQDRETILRSEEWVDTNLPVHNVGQTVFLRLQGRARIDFAELHFRNGRARVVDFREALVGPGTYRLLELDRERDLESVRLVARAETPEATFSVLLQQ